jgi:uncharacterized iron-regulated membrane protein
MLSQKSRLSLTALHRWLGVAAALLLLCQACTGVMISFKDEWARLLDPAMRSMPAPPGAQRISPDAALHVARTAAGDCRPRRLYFPKGDDGVFLLKCSRTVDGADWIVTVDARLARALAAGPVWRFPFEFADEWHLELRSGLPGRGIVGAIGTALAFLSVAGLIVWWPGCRHLARVMKPAWRGGVRRRLLILHRLVGPAAMTFIALLALAGILTAWRPWIEPLVGRVLPIDRPPAIVAGRGDRELLPLGEVERLALSAFPGATVRDIREDGGGDHVVQVVINPVVDARPRAADHAWVDRRNGVLLATRSTAGESAGTRLLGWILPVHTGEWLGLPGRLLMLMAGLSVAVLTISGVISALTRTKRATP